MRFLQLLLVVLLSALCSCTGLHLEKRHYREGYYFNRGSSAHIGQSDTNGKTVSSDVSTEAHYLNDISAATCDTTKPELKPEANSKTDIANQTKENYPEYVSEESRTPSETKPPDEDPTERHIKKTQVLGVLALVLVIIGLAGLEVSIYTFPLLLIGLGCAIFGMKIGSIALQNTKSRIRDKDGNKAPNPKRIRAKRAYWLCLAAILFVAAYLMIRLIAVGGGNTIVVALVLLGICLLAFALFKMGVFSDLSDE